ncbi:MAG: YceH family protein [Endozoicomonas sp.]|uniref:YceH family protein n=1 Tax=Endozoicomonas sp. TaxID=1892382 RepID=UPI003D9B5C0F
MDINLTLNESRVIGCLLEKESTTPDQYPLTLNALVNACNQKSNREPVLSLDEADVRATLDSLIRERFVSEEGGARVSKYRHRFCNTEFSSLQFTEQQRALVCCLLLRGAQTPGELRSRTGRMASFSDVKEVDQVLQGMAKNEWVIQLGREAGKREARYAHLFSGEVDMPTASEVSADDKARIRELEHEVTVLKAEVERLTGLLSENI